MKKTLFSLLTFAAASLGAVPAAVVFDFGGVMTGEQNRESVVHFIRNTFHFSESEFERANHDKRVAVKAGATDQEFWLAYAKAKGVLLPENFSEEFREVMKEAIGVNPKMYSLVNELKTSKIPVAMLSNIDERLGKLVRSFNLYDPFSPCLLSFEIGVEKPDPKAFEILLSRLGLPAGEVVYVDDLVENIEAATSAGLDAILFESTEQIRGHLSRRGLLE